MTDANLNARASALAALGGTAVRPTGLIEYRAGGELLIIGGAEAMDLAVRLPASLSPRVVCLDRRRGAGDSSPIGAAGLGIGIEGYLGQFRVRLGSGPDALLLQADMVLDLSPQPIVSAAVGPPGYLHCVADPEALTEAVATLVEMQGTFDKPEYFSYDPACCAHSRNGTIACTRCIDACPAEAIGSLVERIQIDPHLCQGGGICATVCPSGAIRYAYPSAGDLAKRLRVLLQTYLGASGGDPVILLHAGQSAPEGMLAAHSNLLPVALEEVASAGPELWLTALAYGARRVLLTTDADLPAQVREALEGQLLMVREILAGLGYPSGCVAMLADDEPPWEDRQAMPAIEPSRHAAMDDKRTAFYLALDHLKEQSQRARPLVDLTVGAPFGTAFVEARACTLCMACASVCPANALQDGQGEPRLRFLEANCIQCGLCTRTCPENAIWITPRLLFDPQARNRLKVLYEEEPFCCITCGKPFATRSVIDNMLERLSGHWMFQDERSRQRLKMCDDCRVVDVVQDPEAMGGDGVTHS